MFTSAEKTNQSTFVNRQANAGGAFFGKETPQQSFFSSSKDTGTFFNPGIQAKLSVSHPDDPQEKEADAVADKVMRMPETTVAASSSGAEELQRKEDEEHVDAKQEKEEELQRTADNISSSISIGESISVNRQVAEKEEEKIHTKSYRSIFRQAGEGAEMGGAEAAEEEGTNVHAKLIQRKKSITLFRSGRAPPAGSSNTATFEQTLSSSRGEGSPMSDGTRQSMESRFGTDFSGVRIHTDSRAENMSRSISAHAFTYGNDIYFNSGKYSPNTADGGMLLAHELTHTIQQGATPAMRQSVARKSLQLKRVHRQIQRMEASSQRNAAVELAKAEQGKVSANQEGPDGKRMGWERLLEYFKTTFGADKILPEGAAFQPGTVSEGQIKKKSTFNGNVMDPNDGVTVLHNQPRDAMPSWCGIFAFWALNKGGIPLKKWQLGRGFIPPEAAYPAGHQPAAGDIAYRKEFSHYALVVSSDGSNVTSMNGNTAGDDNVGGEIQLQTHPMDHWFAFFDPTQIMEGSLRNPGGPENAPVRSLRELRKQLFNVNRKAEGEHAEKQEETEDKVQAKTELSTEVSVHASTDTKATADANTNTVVENITPEKSGEGEQEISAKSSGEFDIHRSFENNKQPVADTAEAQQPEAESEGSATEVINRKEEFTSSVLQGVQRRAENMASRGPPRAPPVIQAMVQRKMIQRSWLGDAWNAVSGFVSEAAQWVERGLDAAKEWLLRRVRDFVSNIPGYSMLCLILGEDPITGEPRPMTGTNLLNAGLDLLPGGFMFRGLMTRLGIFNDVASWLEGRIEDMSNIASGISDRFLNFWDRLSLDDVGDPEGVMNRVANLLRSTIEDIVGFITRSATEFLSMIKRVMIREISAFVRARIPRLFPLLTVALGFNPETMETVERNGTNILSAFLEVSEDGREQRRQMMETGTFQRIAGWIDRGIAVFSRAYGLLRQAIFNIWDFVTIENLFHPVDTFTQIYDQVSEPIRIVSQFLIDAAIEILRVIKDALMARLSAQARETRGYSLICVIIGRDPFTGQRVPRTVHNLVRGFMSLMEGGEQQYEQLRESGAIDRIINKVNAAVARLNMTPQAIIQLFIDLWNSFSIRDLAHPIAAFQRIIATFGQPILRLIRFVIEIIMIVVEAILILMNFPFDLISNIIAKARQAYEMIKRDPVGFFKNLLRAIKQGFIQFFDNIATHLLNGLVGWLMAELRDANVPAPTDFSLRGIIGWVLQVLGISMEAVWEKLAQHPRVGPERVARIRSMISTLEGIWTFIRDVQERGIAAIWERIQEQLSNLWNTVLDAIKNWIMERIINAVVTRLLSMLDPTGIMAVVNSVIAMYRAVQSFIRYLRQMLEIVNSFVEGIVEIASGNITRAADFLERTMARGMPIVIGFLANQVGLSGIGARIAELIGAARALVDRALTWLINRAVDTAINLIDRLMALGRSARDAVVGWAAGLLGLQKPFRTADNVSHRLYYVAEGTNVRLMLNPVPAGEYSQAINRVTPPPAPNDRVQIAGPISVPLKRSNAVVGNVSVAPESDGKVSMSLLKTKAIEVATHIDGLIRSNMRTSTDASTGVQDQTADFSASLDGLSEMTKYLLSTGANGPLPVSPVPAYGGLNNGHATRMDVKPLTKLGVPGSGVSITNPVYQDLLLRRETPGGRSYYIAGHLLNNNVHGSGATWQNLTPIAQRTNAEHERNIESKVKTATDNDLILQYTVDVSYNMPEKVNLVQEIENQPGWETNSVLSQKHRILKAEAKLPMSLSCSIKQVKADGTDLPTSDSTYNANYNVTNVPIDNARNVTQTSLNDYYLTSATAVTYKTYAELETDANALLAANPMHGWNPFYSNPSNRVSIDRLTTPPNNMEKLHDIFRRHETIHDEERRIGLLTEMQTWESFNGNRVAYTGTLLTPADKTALRTLFNNTMTGIKNSFIQNETNLINTTVTDASMGWGEFRRIRGFVARPNILSETEIQNFKTSVFDLRINMLTAAPPSTPGTH